MCTVIQNPRGKERKQSMLRTDMQDPSAPIALSGINVSVPNQHQQASYQPVINEVGGMQFLSSQEWPTGLASMFFRNVQKIAMRYFIIDDSGSMATNDGHRIAGTKGHKSFVSCTRWSELGDAMRFHSGLAYNANIVSQFRLLNASGPITVGRPDDDGMGYRRVLELLDNSPSGLTPLCHHINQVVAEIQAMEGYLRSVNQKVVVVIATDGESSDGDVATALKPLERLPATVVIRLCTDEEKVCNYWNQIDKVLELELDILDDLAGEAEEVNEHNKWLTYGEPLQRMREFGVTIKEFDLLDEGKLAPDQILNFIAIMFGMNAKDIPHPQIVWKDFKHTVATGNKEAGLTWDPLTKRYAPWINEHKLGAYFPTKGGVGGCTIC